MTAKELGNQIENVKNNETLQQFLTQVFCLLFYFWLLLVWSRQQVRKL
jgi:hypothetical protein